MLRLPPVLRPRWTWRYVLGAGAATYLIYCFLFASPVFSSKLKPYSGPYSVGAIDIEAPVESRAIHGAKLKDDGKTAFQVSQAQLIWLIWRTSVEE